MRRFQKLRIGRENKKAQPGPNQNGSITVGGNSKEGLFGLRDFNPQASEIRGAKTPVEIVAIHGLNGHPFATWTSDNVIWFSHLLPDLLPDFNPRISTFGYNSAVAFGRSNFRIRDYATQLLTQLQLKRKSSNTLGVPIVFLCHSLGGIVFKKLLTIAHERHSMYEDISKSTRGVMFMGTPHVGSDLANWTRVLRNIGNICTAGSLRADLLKGLESKSAELAELSAQFIERGDAIKIVSVYEGRFLAPLLSVAVERESAVLNLPNETTLPLDADHREICRFSNPKDPRYSAVVLALADLVKDAKVVEDSEREVCLDSLYFPHYNVRRLRVSEAHAGTLSWFWNHPQYEQWERSQSSGLLWLQGKPGSGKSTLANHLRSQLRNKLSYIHDAHCVVADFFYSARGGDDQQGHLWMLRSILYQLLLQAPGLWEDFRETFEPGKVSTSRWVFREWTLQSLQRTFSSLGTKYNRGLPLRVYIIVDAMDESEEDKRQEIVQMLQRTTDHDEDSSIVFKVFVASRPNPKIDHILRNCRYMKLEDETSNDIVEYVKCGVNEIAVEILHRHPHDLESVSCDLINRSKGVFLWVKLVLAELKEQAMEGVCSVAEIEELLRSIPSDLEDVYARIIGKLERNGQAVVRDCQTFLRWVAFSPQPLKLGELQEILAVTLCGTNGLSEAEISRHRVGSPEDMKRRIISRCGNLLEVRDDFRHSDEFSGGPNEVVQFIHQTAREYCLSRMKSSSIQMDETASKIEIAVLCRDYLKYFNSTIASHWKLSPTGADWKDEELRQCIAMIEIQPTLIPYCLGSYRVYAEQGPHSSSNLKEVIQDFLQTMEWSFRVLEGATLASLLLDHVEFLGIILRAPQQINRLIVVPTDHECLLTHNSSSSLDSEPEATRLLTPLHVAVCLKSGALFATHALLGLGGDPNIVDFSGQTPLFQAMASGKVKISDALFDTRPDDHYDSVDDSEDTPDSSSSAQADDNASTDVAITGIGLATPRRSLSLTSQRSSFRDQRVAREVSIDEYNFEQSTNHYYTRKNHLKYKRIRKSKELYSNPCIMDRTGSTAISKALESHHYELARRVLVKAQALGLLNPESPIVSNALYDACRKGDVHAFEILADFATRWDFQDADKRILIDVAKEGGHQEILYRLTLHMGLDYLSLRDK